MRLTDQIMVLLRNISMTMLSRLGSAEVSRYAQLKACTSKLMADSGKALGKKSRHVHNRAIMVAKHQCDASQHIGFTENMKEEDIVRIVHISDTHMSHQDFHPFIPDGDILVHSGDFTNFLNLRNCTTEDLEQTMDDLNSFFGMLPHKHKIFVAGNHEESIFAFHDKPDEIKALLPNGIYLQDEAIILEGIKFYGSPWNTSLYMPFHKLNLKPEWDLIPTDTDILVTHNPPLGIMDLGFDKFWTPDTSKSWCECCTGARGPKVYHGNYKHQGCPDLSEAVLSRIKPKAHLFGHVHNQSGLYKQNSILFCNGSYPCTQIPYVFDYHKAQKRGNLQQKCART